jgi:spermidine/putrescine transport system ATP-binding protein
MFEGAIAQLDTPEALYRRPVSRAVAGFIGVMNFLPGQVGAAGEGVEIAGLGRAEFSAEQIGTARGAVTVGLRPESMSILFTEADTARREARGTVAERYYYGDMTYYDLALDGTSETVTLSMKNIEGRHVLGLGESARIGWDPRAAVVFPAA